MWEFWVAEIIVEMSKDGKPMPRSWKIAYGVTCLILLAMIPFVL